MWYRWRRKEGWEPSWADCGEQQFCAWCVVHGSEQWAGDKEAWRTGGRDWRRRPVVGVVMWIPGRKTDQGLEAWVWSGVEAWEDLERETESWMKKWCDKCRGDREVVSGALSGESKVWVSVIIMTSSCVSGLPRDSAAGRSSAGLSDLWSGLCAVVSLQPETVHCPGPALRPQRKTWVPQVTHLDATAIVQW